MDSPRAECSGLWFACLPWCRASAALCAYSYSVEGRCAWTWADHPPRVNNVIAGRRTLKELPISSQRKDREAEVTQVEVWLVPEGEVVPASDKSPLNMRLAVLLAMAMFVLVV